MLAAISYLRLLLAFALGLNLSVVNAVDVQWSDTEAPLRPIAVFDDVPVGTLDAPLHFHGGWVSAILQGQTIGEQGAAPSGPYRTVSDTPTLPLTPGVVPGLINNLVVFEFSAPGDKTVAGMFDGLLTGSLSVLFDLDQSIIGITIYGTGTTPFSGDPGDGVFQFFARNGSLIDTVTIPALRDGPYTFSVIDPIIAAMTITTDDPFGVAYDLVRGVPAPAPYLWVVPGVGFFVRSLGRHSVTARSRARCGIARKRCGGYCLFQFMRRGRLCFA